MSLEQTLAENTAVMKQLIAVLQSGALPAAAQPEGAKAAGKASKKTDAPAGPAVTTDKGNALGTVEGDPAGTRYWLIEKHNTVYAQRPGEPDCTIKGAVITSAADYLAKKALYAAPLPTSAAGTPTGQPAASPASTTAPAASASPASSSTPAASGVVLDGPAIVARCQALHKAQGNTGLKVVLDKFEVVKVPDLVAKSAQYAEIAAFIDALLNPQPAAAPAEPVNLF